MDFKKLNNEELADTLRAVGFLAESALTSIALQGLPDKDGVIKSGDLLSEILEEIADTLDK